MSNINIAIIPCAGFGTRMLPISKTVPKEMLPVINKPLIQYSYEEAVNAGIKKIIFIISENKQLIQQYFQKNEKLEIELKKKKKDVLLKTITSYLSKDIEIHFVIQEEQNGLGHAIFCARKMIKEPFAVLLPDELFNSRIPALKQMIQEYHDCGNYLGIKQIPIEEANSYGIVKFKDVVKNKKSEIDFVIEKPSKKEAPSNFFIAGRYILQPEIFNYLEKQEIGVGGEIQLTDAINKMIKNCSTYGIELEGERHDAGSLEGLIRANVDFAKKLNIIL